MFLSLLMTSIMHLHFIIEEEDILEHAKLWQDLSVVYTLVNLQTIMWHRHAPHNNIEHTHAKILAGAR